MIISKNIFNIFNDHFDDYICFLDHYNIKIRNSKVFKSFSFFFWCNVLLREMEDILYFTAFDKKPVFSLLGYSVVQQELLAQVFERLLKFFKKNIANENSILERTRCITKGRGVIDYKSILCTKYKNYDFVVNGFQPSL